MRGVRLFRYYLIGDRKEDIPGALEFFVYLSSAKVEFRKFEKDNFVNLSISRD